MALNDLIASAGRAALTRTYLLERKTFNNIPSILMVFDAVTSEDPTFEADVTEVPVEEGKEVTDHIQLKNPRLTLQGVVSQTPLDLQVTIGNLVGGSVEAATSSQFRQNLLNTGLQQASGVASAALLGQAANPLTGAAGGLADAIARSLLLSAYERKARFDVVTKRQRYSSMVIQKMQFPYATDTGNQLRFILEMKQVRIVAPFQVQIDTVSEDTVTSAVGKTDLGTQAKAGLSGNTEEAANQSVLAAIDDQLGITGGGG